MVPRSNLHQNTIKKIINKKRRKESRSRFHYPFQVILRQLFVIHVGRKCSVCSLVFLVTFLYRSSSHVLPVHTRCSLSSRAFVAFRTLMPCLLMSPFSSLPSSPHELCFSATLPLPHLRHTDHLLRHVFTSFPSTPKVSERLVIFSYLPLTSGDVSDFLPLVNGEETRGRRHEFAFL